MRTMPLISIARLAVLVPLATFVAGCGGLGSGPSTPPRWTVALVQQNYESNKVKDQPIQGRWVDANHPYADHGPVVFESARVPYGTGDVSITSDGSIKLVNTQAAGTIELDYTTHHPAGDPKAGDPEYGTVTIALTAVNTTVSPTDFRVPQGGTMKVAAQADNSRAAGRVVFQRLYGSQAPTRAAVNVPATWTITPASAGSMSDQDYWGAYAFTGAASFAGTFTLTPRIANALDQPPAIKGTAIAHPTLGIAAPADKQVVTGTISVQITAQNVDSVYWRMDLDREYPAPGASFPLDSTFYANGNHTLSFRLVGPLETVSFSRNFTVNNPPHQFGPWSGIIAYTQSDVSGGSASLAKMVEPTATRDINAIRPGRFISWSPDGTYLTDGQYLVDRSGTLRKTWSSAAGIYCWFPNSSGILAGYYMDALYKQDTDGNMQRLVASASRTYDHNPAFSRDGKWAYFVHNEWGENGSVRWIAFADLIAGRGYSEFLTGFQTGHDEQVILETTAEGNLVVGYQGTTVLFDPGSKTNIVQVDGYSANVRCSPDGKYLAVQRWGQTGADNNKESVSILNATTLGSVGEITVRPGSGVQSFAWAPDSSGVAISYYDQIANPVVYTIAIWRLSDRHLQEVFKQSGTAPATPSRGYQMLSSSLAWAP